MKQTISFYDFERAFHDIRPDNFSYSGLKALFDYLEEYEESTDEEIELDVIAICCDYSEYESADEAASNYFEYEGMEYDDDGSELLDADEVEEKALGFLRDRTEVIEFDGGIIIRDF